MRNFERRTLLKTYLLYDVVEKLIPNVLVPSFNLRATTIYLEKYIHLIISRL